MNTQTAQRVIDTFLVGGTNGYADNARAVLALRSVSDNPELREYTLQTILRKRRQWLAWRTVVQREWQMKTRRASRARHHDSISIREKYVRCQ